MFEKISTLSDSALDLLLENATMEKAHREEVKKRDVVEFSSMVGNYRYNMKDHTLELVSLGESTSSKYSGALSDVMKISVNNRNVEIFHLRQCAELFNTLANAIAIKIKSQNV